MTTSDAENRLTRSILASQELKDVIQAHKETGEPAIWAIIITVDVEHHVSELSIEFGEEDEPLDGDRWP